VKKLEYFGGRGEKHINKIAFGYM